MIRSRISLVLFAVALMQHSNQLFAQTIGINAFSGVDKDSALGGLRYSEFVVPLVKSAQELDQENKVPAQKLAAMEAGQLLLKAEITELKAMMSVR